MLRSLIVPAFLALECAAAGQPSTVWQIGKFDDASREFGGGAQGAVYIVGKSDPARDWNADQLAADTAASSGGRAIEFGLPGPPRGLYTLKLSLLTYNPRLPSLEVNVNGRRGRFYLHPVINYSGGHAAGRFIPIYSKSVIAFDVPTPFLQERSNRITLTPVCEPPAANTRISYDALALEHDPAKSFSSEALGVDVLPTIFYKETAGGLAELTDVFVRYNERPQNGRVTLAAGSKQLSQELASVSDFGEQRLRLEVPDFGPSAASTVTVAMNGRTRRFPVELKAARKWNLFVVPHQHLDIGYTDHPPKVAEVQARALDEAIDMIGEHPEFRYTLDAYWVAEQFLAGRSPAQQQKFLQLLREKKIFLPANYAALHTGVANIENVLRSFYRSRYLNRQNGADFDHAIVTDLPSHSWSYPSELASAGLKYLVLPCNNDLGPMLILGRLHEKSPFWWEGPDGQRVLTWYSRHYHQVSSLFGLPPSLDAGQDSLPIFLQTYAGANYRSDAAMIFGSQVENTDLYREQATLARDWNRVFAYPKVKFSGVAEALSYIAGQTGDAIPVLRGDGGPYWDIFTAIPSMGPARETDHRTLTAEKLATAASLVDPRIWPDRVAMEQLWTGLLNYTEHHGSGGRNGALRARHDKDLMTMQNARLAEHALARGMSALAESIHVPAGTLIVFNSMNWPRSRLVEINLARNQELVDRATNQVVPFEELAPPRGPGLARAGTARRVRFLAAGVPAVGYKCYTLRQAMTAAETVSRIEGSTLENAYYRVELDASAGGIRSLFDKELNHELADRSSAYRLNQYVSATGQQDPMSTSGLSTAIVPPPNLEIRAAGGGRIVSVTRTPFGSVARLEASAPNAPRIATEIVLFDGEKRIEITNRVQHQRGGPEWRYFAFPFAMDRPEFKYEIQNGVVNPARDALPGAGREWFPVQHWAAVEQDGVTAAITPLDAAMVTFGDIIRYSWGTEFGRRKGTIFSYLGRGTDQELTYRYAITSGRGLKPEALSRAGWDAMSPFELNEVIPQDKVGNPPRPLDGSQGSFLTADAPGLVLTAWKPAEDGKGTILRFVETAGRAGTAKIDIPILEVEQAWSCNSVEENREALPRAGRGFSFKFRPFEIVTVRVAGTGK